MKATQLSKKPNLAAQVRACAEAYYRGEDVLAAGRLVPLLDGVLRIPREGWTGESYTSLQRITAEILSTMKSGDTILLADLLMHEFAPLIETTSG